MTSTRFNRRRKLGIENLEKRQLLAGLISEFSMAPIDQFLELRGEPNAVLPSGTYVTIVESTGNTLGGRVDTVLDLSGQAYGDNGFLVIAMANHSFEIDPSATALVSGTSSASGLPGGIYVGGSFSAFTGSAFLLQSAVAPASGDDIDANADGIIDPDGVAGAWTIHDSVTIGTIHDYFGYGKTVFGALSRQQSLQADSIFIATDERGNNSLDYAARVGDSSGSGADDWVAGRLINDLSNNQGLRIDAGGFTGSPTTPSVFSGRRVDHVGTHNFFGGVQGTAFNDVTRQPISGLTLLADTNANGTRDVITTIIEPDSFAAGTDMTNAIPGVTLTVADRDDTLPHGTIEPRSDTRGLASTGTSVFSDDGIRFSFDEGLRVEFYRTADSVQIDAIGTSISSPVVARMEAFNRSGESIGLTRSSSLLQGQRQQLSLSSDNGDIAFVLIYEDAGNGTLVNYDRLIVSQKEAIATTDSRGQYRFQYLTPGTYDITVPNALSVIPKLPIGGSASVTVDSTEQFNVDFVFGENKPPVIDQTMLLMDIDENAPISTPVGTVVATDPDAGQAIRYRLVDGTGRRYFALNPTTGEIRVNNPIGLDFELAREYTLVVEAADNFSPSKSDRATITVSINNANDPPTFHDNRFSIDEDALSGSIVGTVAASDQDALNDDSSDPTAPNDAIGIDSGKFTFAIADPVYGDMFAIDALSGLLTLTDAAALDFETAPDILLKIAATDQGLEPQTKLGQVRIKVRDVNEPPQLANRHFAIRENIQPGANIGTPLVLDPEQHTMFKYAITSGNGQSSFTIDPDSGMIQLASNATLDYETQTSYELVVRVDEVPDANGQPAVALGAESTITIDIVDLDEPPLVDFTAAVIDENSPAGTVVSTLAAIDPEASSIIVTQRSGNASFVFDTQTQELKVAPGAVIDFESGVAYAVQLRVADSSMPPNFTDVLIPVEIRDLPETASIATQTLRVAENAAEGTLAAKVVAVDPDFGDSLTYEIVGGDGAAVFGIESASGQLTLLEGASLDFEAGPVEYDLNVKVTDGTGLIATQLVQVLIDDVNEPPTIVEPFANLQLRAGSRFCFSFGDALFADPDNNTQFDVSVSTSSGELPSWLRYDSATRQLQGTPQATDLTAMSVIVRVTDSSDTPLSATDAFVVSVLDSDDGDFYTSDCFSPWQNSSNRFDVNNNGDVAPIDAVIVLNYLNRNGPGVVPTDQSPLHFLDVDGDNVIRPLDVLQVLNFLSSAVPAASGSLGEAEAEDAFVIDEALRQMTAAEPSTSATPATMVAAVAVSNQAADNQEEEAEDEFETVVDQWLISTKFI